jgi:hypothetical protein
VNVHPLTVGDDASVRKVFRATLALGAAVPFAGPAFDRYESLCLDWFLGAGRADAAVLVDDDGEVVGYALVCTDQEAHARWARRKGAAFAGRVVGGLALRRYPPAERRFYRARLRDGYALWRAGSSPPMPASAHMNLLPGHRGGANGRLLAAHIDARVRHAGLPGWFGEINAPAGRRAGALERLGGRVVSRVPNRTLSRLLGRPVERLTVVRTLPEIPAEAADAAA